MEILALHGFTGLGSDFAPFAELCSGNWTTPDLPGHGSSHYRDCDVDSTIAFIQQQSQYLYGNIRILIGYSMGSRAALNHAIHYPDAWDGLILISANPGIDKQEEKERRRIADNKLASRIETESIEAFLKYWHSLPIIASQQNIDPTWLASMNQARSNQTPKGLAASLRDFGQGVCPNLWPGLQMLRIPTLLLSGELDTKYTEIGKRLTASLPHAEHCEISSAGHMPHLENPIESSQAINSFLKRFE